LLTEAVSKCLTTTEVGKGEGGKGEGGKGEGGKGEGGKVIKREESTLLNYGIFSFKGYWALRLDRLV
jgi:hypothetical protein